MSPEEGPQPLAKFEKFRKPYNAAETEPRVYSAWEESGYFNPDNLPAELTAQNGKPFTIVMPPPNATGILHMGHALGLTIQDIIIRFKRMQGFSALFLPGTDHAAIATHARVEKDISKTEGKSRHDLGRAELVRRIEEFVEGSRSTMQKQMRVMGASSDWSREAFTFDEARSKAVNTLFKMMYEAGLIYQGNRIVNWDPQGQTTISDDEIVHEERDAKLYTFRYSKDFPIPIATTRLETKVGDVAVAVHPDDARYQKYIGQEFDVTFCDVPLHLKIIADESVEPEFGSGALGVTPAHSHIDWEIADRHDLPRPQVINEHAKMTVEGSLHDKKVLEAREIVAEWLRSEGLLEKEESIRQNVSTAERTGGIIEPLPKLQWFIAVNKKFILPYSEIAGIPSGSETTLKELMRTVVASHETRIIPEYFEKTYFHWIDNLRDWCISRQIWYGHRVPVWYQGETLVTGEKPSDGEWVQDEDTLDTWFSAGTWSFSTLGWPEITGDLKKFHPTDVLVPAYEILFFWVARMILMSGFALGQVPFKNVYLTGIVRDAKGRKFSKSLGNGIDPIEIAEKYGVDAARMSLVVGNTPGTDMRLDENKIKAYKHFANKLWNIARFIFENTEDMSPQITEAAQTQKTAADQALWSEMELLIGEVTKDLEEYRFYLAGEKLYQYGWGRLADEILEESKKIFAAADQADEASEAAANSRRATLRKLLSELLKMLHPFMPFVTEEIWSAMPEHNTPLIITPWPVI
jgi:valyl-tRNA synthetase